MRASGTSVGDSYRSWGAHLRDRREELVAESVEKLRDFLTVPLHKLQDEAVKERADGCRPSQRRQKRSNAALCGLLRPNTGGLSPRLLQDCRLVRTQA